MCNARSNSPLNNIVNNVIRVEQSENNIWQEKLSEENNHYQYLKTPSY